MDSSKFQPQGSATGPLQEHHETDQHPDADPHRSFGRPVFSLGTSKPMEAHTTAQPPHNYAASEARQFKKEPPWWALDLTYDTIDPSTRTLLEEYSGISPDAVVAHCKQIREQAWEVFRYVCIGQFRFLDLSIGRSPLYSEILERAKSGQRYLDLGCCFAQDIRRLVYDGAPRENLVGVELEPEFFELGYELFRDRETLGVTLISADIFDGRPEAPLNDEGQLKGTVDMVHASSFFHLFTLPDQKRAMARTFLLLRKRPGSFITGRQMGRDTPGRRHSSSNSDSERWVQSPQSLCETWHAVAAELGLSIEAHAEELPNTRAGRDAEDQRFLMRYEVRFL